MYRNISSNQNECRITMEMGVLMKMNGVTVETGMGIGVTRWKGCRVTVRGQRTWA